MARFKAPGSRVIPLEVQRRFVRKFSDSFSVRFGYRPLVFAIDKLPCDLLEFVGYREERIDNIGIKVVPRARRNHFYCSLMRDGFFVAATAYQRIVHIGNCHEPSRYRDIVTPDAQRISGTIPLFLMRIRDLFRNPQKRDFEIEARLGSFNCVAAQGSASRRNNRHASLTAR